MSAGSTESILGIGKDNTPIKNPYGNQYKTGFSYKDKEREVYSSIGSGIVKGNGKEVNLAELGMRALSESRASKVEGIDVGANFVNTIVDKPTEAKLKEQKGKNNLDTVGNAKRSMGQFWQETKALAEQMIGKFEALKPDIKKQAEQDEVESEGDGREENTLERAADDKGKVKKEQQTSMSSKEEVQAKFPDESPENQEILASYIDNFREALSNKDSLDTDKASQEAARKLITEAQSKEQKKSGIKINIGFQEAHASTGAAAAVEMTLGYEEALLTLAAVTKKYGPTAGKFVVQKVAPKLIPGIGLVLLAKDVYDVGKLAYRHIKGSANPTTMVDTEAGKPKVLATPKEERKAQVETFPGEKQAGIVLPGFDMHEESSKAHIGSFPVEDFPDMIILEKRELPDTVVKVNNRYPINAGHAGDKYPIHKLPEYLQAKYPESVVFDEEGFPDFSPHAIHEVKVEGLSGDYARDERIANKAIGLKVTPEGYTWHHLKDGKTMQCVPRELHWHIKHTGGAAILKKQK